jgi:hydroxymethylbilane synthase
LLRALRPDLDVKELRGNVNTRLAKLDAGEFDAIILACAGLMRLGFGDRIRSRLTAPDWLPAVAQGAIGIESRAGDHAAQALVAPLIDGATMTCVGAERAMNRVLQGSCDVPIAGFATLDGNGGVSLAGLVGDPVGGRLIRASANGDASAAASVGEKVAADLLRQGADEILDRRRHA